MLESRKEKFIRLTKKRRKKRILNIAVFFVLAIMCFASYFVISIIEAALKGMDHNVAKSNLRKEQITLKKDPFTILLIGSDGRPKNPKDWRPDVLMLLVVNPKTKSIKTISIPRDTLVEIANTNGFKTKINSAVYWGYQKGIDPIQNIRETIENLLKIPIDYYVKTNFEGFTKIVDSLGGVTVDVKFPFSQKALGGKKIFFEKGFRKLNGIEALAYVRMRKQDPEGDHGRNKRQQEVIYKLVDKITSLNGMTKILNIIDTLGNNITYSLPISETITLCNIYMQCKNNIETIKMNTTSKKIKGIWYEILNKNEKERIHKILKKQLEFN